MQNKIFSWMLKLLFMLSFIAFAVVACKDISDMQNVPIVHKQLPFVKANINGVEGYLLVDSGSSKTLLSDKLNYNVDVDSAMLQQIKHFNGTSTCVQTKTEVPIGIGNIQCSIYVRIGEFDVLLNELQRISNVPVIGILGSDYLYEIGAIIDMYNLQLLVFDDRHVTKQSCVGDDALQTCNVVIVSSTVN